MIDFNPKKLISHDDQKMLCDIIMRNENFPPETQEYIGIIVGKTMAFTHHFVQYRMLYPDMPTDGILEYIARMDTIIGNQSDSTLVASTSIN